MFCLIYNYLAVPFFEERVVMHRGQTIKIYSEVKEFNSRYRTYNIIEQTRRKMGIVKRSFMSGTGSVWSCRLCERKRFVIYFLIKSEISLPVLKKAKMAIQINSRSYPSCHIVAFVVARNHHGRIRSASAAVFPIQFPLNFNLICYTFPFTCTFSVEIFNTPWGIFRPRAYVCTRVAIPEPANREFRRSVAMHTANRCCTYLPV